MQLQELKKSYDTCQLEKKNYSTLLQKREAIHDKILQIKEKTEMALYTKTTIPPEMESLDALKKTLKIVDDQLDALGEDHDEKLLYLKASLIKTIQEVYPDSVEEYERLQINAMIHHKEVKKYTQLIHLLGPFRSALTEGAQAKQSRGLLGVLLGRNSKIILARAIRKAVIEAERIHARVGDETMQHFLDTFLEEANRPWNGALYKEQFYVLHQEFFHLIESIKEKKKRASQEALNTEKEIELWIQNYCDMT